MLRAHLLVERPAGVAGLHRRASDWYAAQGDPAAAVRHALAAGDVAGPRSSPSSPSPSWAGSVARASSAGWVDDLPDQVLENRPVLAIGWSAA